MDEDGNSLGVLPTNEALRIAIARGFDLVEIAPNSSPPVAKIIDYGKYNYERQKKDKLAKKNQVTMNVKEIRYNANTDTHDFEFKSRHLRQFLLDGHKVKASITYKGRMITHPEIGQKLMQEVLERVLELGKLESNPRMEGKLLIAYILPDKNKIQLYKEKLAKQTSEEKKQEAENNNKIQKEITENAKNEI
ncbi:MAG TPA: translation initiation factor IF-3 [Ignavibacteria bacterium]